MVKLNHHFQKLPSDTHFFKFEKKLEEIKKKTSGKSFLNLANFEASEIFVKSPFKALSKAAEQIEQVNKPILDSSIFGYEKLRKTIANTEYKNICFDEIFITLDAKQDITNIQEIFCQNNKIAVQDPTHPIYVESNVIAGRTRSWIKAGGFGAITYLSCDAANEFQPEIPTTLVDIIYLSSPNFPTGVSLKKNTLEKFVQYAKKNKAILIFDSSFEKFISSDAPHSIYEIDGAKEVAIEIKSFSKFTGYAGLSFSYTVIPHELKVQDAGAIRSLHSLWSQRTILKKAHPCPLIQSAFLELFSNQASQQSYEMIQTYKLRSLKLLKGLEELGYTVFGGKDSIFVWCKTPPRVNSWEFFDFLLKNIHIITIPGIVFGNAGDEYICLSGFSESDVIEESLSRFKNLA
jgi:LL-diaminopimelate aminotransferase